jgi:FixJ family two-component response regulator
VLDLQLPGMSGIELMRRLRSEAREVPTVFVTGFDVRLRWEEVAGRRAAW